MIVVNLFGVPGSGKSTGAAYIFSKLKMAGLNVELVGEFAKDKVWEETKAVFENQAYIFGKQSFRISRCENKVDVIITDSPLPLSIFYNKNKHIYGKSFDRFVMDVFNHYTNINFFINRIKPYNPNGRFQTEEESNALKAPMVQFLNEMDISYTEIDGDIDGYDSIAETVVNCLRLKHLANSSEPRADFEEAIRILTQKGKNEKHKEESAIDLVDHIRACVKECLHEFECTQEAKKNTQICHGSGRYCAHEIGNVCPFSKPCSSITEEDWMKFLLDKD